MKNKIVCIITMFIILIPLLSSCSNKNKTIDPLEKILNKELLQTFHTKRLKDKETRYTLCFENSDGTSSVYIFSSPVSFLNDAGELEVIDNALTKVTDKKIQRKGYFLENEKNDIKCYFPKNLRETPLLIKNGDYEFSFLPDSKFIRTELKETTYTDLLGKVNSAITYQSEGNIIYNYIPSNSGIMMNIQINKKPESNKLDFYLDINNSYCEVKDNQYVTIKNNDDNGYKAIIYTSYLVDRKGKTSFNNKVSLSNSNGKIKYTINLDNNFLASPDTQFPIIITPSFEIYRDKEPDSSVYLNKANTNLYLLNYAVLGNDPFWGDNINYLRFRVNYFLKTYEQNVKKAVYSATCLSADSLEMQIEMRRLKDMWSSTGINWNKKSPIYKVESSTLVSNKGKYEFDITDFIKSSISDDKWNTEAYGLAMTAGKIESGAKIIATSDNGFYPTYIRIDFYKTPWTFEKVDKINPE